VAETQQGVLAQIIYQWNVGWRFSAAALKPEE
jgi:hypothetical protein